MALTARWQSQASTALLYVLPASLSLFHPALPPLAIDRGKQREPTAASIATAAAAVIQIINRRIQVGDAHLFLMRYE